MGKKKRKIKVAFSGTTLSILWIRDSEKIPHTWNLGLALMSKNQNKKG